MSGTVRNAIRNEAAQILVKWEIVDISTDEKRRAARAMKQRYEELKRVYRRLAQEDAFPELPPPRPRIPECKPAAEGPTKAPVSKAVATMPERRSLDRTDGFILSAVALAMAIIPYVGLAGAPMAIVALLNGARGNGLKKARVLIAALAILISAYHWLEFGTVLYAFIEVSTTA